MCRASGIFQRPSFKAATISCAPQPLPGICTAPGRKRSCASSPTPDTRRSSPAILTSSCLQLIATAAAEPLRLRARFAVGVALLAWMQLLPLAAHAAGTKLLRFPNVWHERIVFSYAGDLWTVGTQGGTATRLTASPGLKLFGKFSPDGRQIAFTAEYGGDEQVYVMPSGGGAPKQLTFYPAPGPLAERWGYDNQVYGWTPDGTAVLFRSARDGYTLTGSKLYTVAVNGGAAMPLPMPMSGA